jgi:hypothetical protein
MGGEISTRRILEELFREKRAVALPRIEGSDLRLHRVTSMAQLAPGRFGITEPLADTPAVSESEPDLLLVPGVAFDRRGHRVGYGKGFYDRLLQHTNAPVIALAYGFQLVHHVRFLQHNIFPVAQIHRMECHVKQIADSSVFLQLCGNNSHNHCPVLFRTFCQSFHQSGIGTAVNQPLTMLPQPCAQFPGFLHKYRFYRI